MNTPARSLPESQGPGQETAAGFVQYGVRGPVASFPEDSRPMRGPVDNPRCDRCRELPDDLVSALATALRTAARDGRLAR